MNNDCMMIYESYGTLYRGSKTEQDSKNYTMNLTPFMYIIKQLSKGTFDTDSEQDTVSKGELQGIFDVEVVNGKRQVVLTNDAVKEIEQMHPELKGKFWECGKCKADYAGCGAAKKEHSEDAEMPTSDFNKLKQHINKGPIQLKRPSKELPYTHKYIHHLAKQDSREGQHDEDEQRRLDPKCWKGYHKSGTKLKDGVRVNNCVKNS